MYPDLQEHEHRRHGFRPVQVLFHDHRRDGTATFPGQETPGRAALQLQTGERDALAAVEGDSIRRLLSAIVDSED